MNIVEGGPWLVAYLTEEEIYQKSPQELTSLLYQKCIENLESVILEIKDGRFIEANRLLQRCNDILHRLGAGINYEAGVIADQLELIYNYIAERLIEANVKKDVAIIEECLRLLRILSEGWDEAMRRSKRQALPIRQLFNQTKAYDLDYMYDNSIDHKE